MSRWFFIGLALATTLGILGLGSCTQAEGERCQRDEDCESGLVCCKEALAEPTSDGICRPEGAACASTPTDGGSDTTREDAGSEAEATAEAEAEATAEAEAEATAEAEAEAVEEVAEETDAETVEEAEADVDETTEIVEDVPDEITDALPETDA
jgi:hypothetical protein